MDAIRRDMLKRFGRQILEAAARAPAPAVAEVASARPLARKAVVVQAVAAMDDARLSALSARERLVLVKGLGSEAPAGTALEALARLYATAEIDPAFLAWEKPRRTEFQRYVNTDPFVTETKPGWKGFSPEEKVERLRRISDAKADIYGYHKPGVTPFYADRMSNGFLLGGEYVRESNGIRINTHQDARLSDFTESLALVEHEGTHAFQADLARKYRARLIPEDAPHYAQAGLFAESWNGGLYLTAAMDEALYRTNPIERHANASERDLKRHLAQARFAPRPAPGIPRLKKQAQGAGNDPAPERGDKG